MNNKIIIEIFEKLLIYYQIIGDRWREQSYRKVINQIKAYNKPIKSGNEALQINGIGSGTADKIDKILNGAKLETFISSNAIDIIDIYSKLRRIRDIGDKKAKELIKEYKIMSIPQLKKMVQSGKITLTKNQLIGLKYYEDLIKPIPYNEIKRFENYLSKIIEKIDPKLEVYILGSYRRKKAYSNDIDIMLLDPKIKTIKSLPKAKKIIFQLMEYLSNKGVLKVILKEGSLDKIGDSINLEYLFKLPGGKYLRKVDVKFYPYESKIPALLYFTGSKDHNKYIRELVHQRGYLLNQYGLFKKGPNNSMTKLPLKNEKDIYKFLGIKYVPPEKRI